MEFFATVKSTNEMQALPSTASAAHRTSSADPELGEPAQFSLVAARPPAGLLTSRRLLEGGLPSSSVETVISCLHTLFYDM